MRSKHIYKLKNKTKQKRYYGKTQHASQQETELFFRPGADAPHAYLRAWTLCCFQSLISTRTLRRASTASTDSCAEIYRMPLDGVTSSGSIWRKVPARKRSSECANGYYIKLCECDQAECIYRVFTCMPSGEYLRRF